MTHAQIAQRLREVLAAAETARHEHRSGVHVEIAYLRADVAALATELEQADLEPALRASLVAIGPRRTDPEQCADTVERFLRALK